MADRIVCIRHGEKPTNAEDEHKGEPPDEEGPGFDQCGSVDRHSLTTKGWARAFALGATHLCGWVPREGKDVAIFVPAHEVSSERRRTFQTVLPLALRLEIAPRVPCPKKDVDTLKRVLLDCDRPVAVVCWEHDALEKLVDRLTNEKPTWDDEDFKSILILQRDGNGAGWTCKASEQDFSGLWLPLGPPAARG